MSQEKLRLGGMALRNGLLVHGPTHWAAAVRGSDGTLKVFYDELGLKFQTYDQWIASGAQVPAGAPVQP